MRKKIITKSSFDSNSNKNIVLKSVLSLWKTVLWESEKMILIMFLIICYISIKTLLILINYQKWYIILVTKRK